MSFNDLIKKIINKKCTSFSLIMGEIKINSIDSVITDFFIEPDKIVVRSENFEFLLPNLRGLPQDSVFEIKSLSDNHFLLLNPNHAFEIKLP